jgi:adenylate cyclase
LISAPAGVSYAIVQRYWEARRQRDRVRAAFRFFVPLEVADELERNASQIVATRKSLECACVATDAARFTTLAEGMGSEALTDFLNEYFDSLFKPVIEHGGFVSDVVGDAMLAIWPDRTADTRRVVCHALLQMRDAADEFNRLSAENRLITRFGANWGKVTLATVGARAHYEYRAVGDPVNTANRIQELNKKFGTRILVSKALIEGLDGFAIRNLGSFLLRGKTTPEEIFELINTNELATTDEVQLALEFGKALQILGTGAKAPALAAFQDIRARYPGDGATAFYIQYLLSGKPLEGNTLSLD